MKKLKLIAVLYSVALGLALNGIAQPAEGGDTPPPAEEPMPAAPEPPEQSQPEEVIAPLIQEVLENGAAEPNMVIIQGMPEALPAEPDEPNSFVRQGTTPPRYIAPMAAGATNAQPAAVFNLDEATANAIPLDKVVKDGESGIRLNFRNAPLDQVLTYLSSIAGFTITAEVDVRGRVNIWSNQPMTKEEAIELLNSELAKQGFAVLQVGKLLTITTQAAAVRASGTPVKVGYSHTNIQPDQVIITQIVPVRFINAAQLVQDLQPLMPSQMTMTANAGGNALVFTGMRRDIRRLVEIINALDTTVSSLSAVKVFALEYADAKEVATMVKEMFAGTESGGGGGGGRGGRGGGGAQGLLQFMGGGGAGGGATATTGRPGASKVVATSDERSNSLVVSAPEELMLTIERLVLAMDINVDDLTVIRMFRLKHADPQQTCDLLTGLFPDPTTQQGARGGGRGGANMFAAATTAAGQSERKKRQSKVVSVPDLRTGSVVVTATQDMMGQIESLIKDLDSDAAREKKVYSIKIDNTDPTTMKETLDALFSGNTTAANRNRTTTGAGAALNQRATTQNQNQGRTTGATGRTGGTGGATFGGTQ